MCWGAAGDADRAAQHGCGQASRLGSTGIAVGLSIREAVKAGRRRGVAYEPGSTCSCKRRWIGAEAAERTGHPPRCAFADHSGTRIGGGALRRCRRARPILPTTRREVRYGHEGGGSGNGNLGRALWRNLRGRFEVVPEGDRPKAVRARSVAVCHGTTDGARRGLDRAGGCRSREKRTSSPTCRKSVRRPQARADTPGRAGEIGRPPTGTGRYLRVIRRCPGCSGRVHS